LEYRKLSQTVETNDNTEEDSDLSAGVSGSLITPSQQQQQQTYYVSAHWANWIPQPLSDNTPIGLPRKVRWLRSLYVSYGFSDTR